MTIIPMLETEVVIVEPGYELEPLPEGDEQFILALVSDAEHYHTPLALRFAAIDADNEAAFQLQQDYQ